MCLAKVGLSRFGNSSNLGSSSAGSPLYAKLPWASRNPDIVAAWSPRLQAAYKIHTPILAAEARWELMPDNVSMVEAD